MNDDDKAFFNRLNGLFLALNHKFTANHFRDMVQLYLLWKDAKPGVMLDFDLLPDEATVEKTFLAPLRDLISSRVPVTTYVERCHDLDDDVYHRVWVVQTEWMARLNLEFSDEVDCHSWWRILGYPSDMPAQYSEAYSISHHLRPSKDLLSLISFDDPLRCDHDGAAVYDYRITKDVYKERKADIEAQAHAITRALSPLGESRFISMSTNRKASQWLQGT